MRRYWYIVLYLCPLLAFGQSNKLYQNVVADQLLFDSTAIPSVHATRGKLFMGGQDGIYWRKPSGAVTRLDSTSGGTVGDSVRAAYIADTVKHVPAIDSARAAWKSDTTIAAYRTTRVQSSLTGTVRATAGALTATPSDTVGLASALAGKMPSTTDSLRASYKSDTTIASYRARYADSSRASYKSDTTIAAYRSRYSDSTRIADSSRTTNFSPLFYSENQWDATQYFNASAQYVEGFVLTGMDQYISVNRPDVLTGNWNVKLQDKSGTLAYTSDIPDSIKTRGFVDIRDYAVTGDGSTNDSSAIASAIANAISTNRTLLIRPLSNGNKVFSTGGHFVTSRIDILFQGGASFKQRTPATTTRAALIKFGLGSAGSTLRGAVLDGNRDALRAAHIAAGVSTEWSGIEVQDKDITIDGCEIKEAVTTAILSDSTVNDRSRLRILNTYIHDCAAGIIENGINELEMRGAVLRDRSNDSVKVYQHAVDIWRSKKFTVDGLEISTSGGDSAGLSVWFSGLTILESNGNVDNLLIDSSNNKVTPLAVSIHSSAVRGTNWRITYWNGVGLELSSMQSFSLSDFLFEGRYASQGFTTSWYGYRWYSGAYKGNLLSRGITLSNGTIKKFSEGMVIGNGNISLTNVNVLSNASHGIDIRNWGTTEFGGAVPETTFSNLSFANVVAKYNGGSGIIFTKGSDVSINGGAYSDNGQDTTLAAALRAGIADQSGGNVDTISVNGVFAQDDQGGTSTGIASLNYGVYSGAYAAGDTVSFSLATPKYFENQKLTIGTVQVRVLNQYQDTIRCVTRYSGTYPSTLTGGTGTISTSGTAITGSGTAFLTELPGLYWIKANSQYRRVVKVTSNTVATLESAFGSNLSGATFEIVKLDVVGVPSQQYGMYLTQASGVIGGGNSLAGNVTGQTSITTLGSNVMLGRLAVGELTTAAEQIDVARSGANTILEMTTYDAGASSSNQIAFRHSGGTIASPDSTFTGKVLGVLSFRGRTNNGFSGTKARIQAVAGSPWARAVAGTDSSTSTQLEFSTTPGGSTTLATRMTINPTGNVGIGDASPASMLTVGNGDLFQVNSSGQVVKVNNVTAEGPFGVPTIVDTVERAALTTSQAAAALTATTVAGNYQIDYYLYCTTASGTATVTVTIDWDNATKTFTSGSVSMASVNNYIQGTIPIRNVPVSSSAIRWSTTVTGTISSATYAVSIVAKRQY